MGWIHSVERGVAVDGPGLRYLVFLSGCAWRCQYCHNPDTWSPEAGKPTEIGDLIQDIREYAPFLSRGGGVTLSGGEPLVQAGFAGELLRAVKSQLGLHTCLDTNGHLAGSLPDAWFEAVDLVLLDLKLLDPVAHRALTGSGNDEALALARRLARLGKPAWIRRVLVPGVTDGDAEIDALADLVLELGNVERVEVLPFHQLGSAKWERLGLHYPYARRPSCPPERVEEVCDRLRRRGLDAR